LREYINDNCDIDPENAKCTFAEGVTITKIHEDFCASHPLDDVSLSYFHTTFTKYFAKETAFQRKVHIHNIFITLLSGKFTVL